MAMMKLTSTASADFINKNIPADRENFTAKTKVHVSEQG